MVLDLQLTTPRGCRGIDDLVISIRQAKSGRFRFGPSVPGARPRHDGQRIKRWCRGTYRGSVVSTDQFAPDDAEELANGRFVVK